MNEIRITRFAYEPDCVLSWVTVLWRDGSLAFECYGIELPMLHNIVGKSCIPEGEYQARVGLHRGGPGPSDDYAAIELDNVPGRTEIEIHAANTPSELRGCIAVGRRLGTYRGERAVLESRAALRGIFRALGEPAHGAKLVVKVDNFLLKFWRRGDVGARA